MRVASGSVGPAPAEPATSGTTISPIETHAARTIRPFRSQPSEFRPSLRHLLPPGSPSGHCDVPFLSGSVIPRNQAGSVVSPDRSDVPWPERSYGRASSLGFHPIPTLLPETDGA